MLPRVKQAINRFCELREIADLVHRVAVRIVTEHIAVARAPQT